MSVSSPSPFCSQDCGCMPEQPGFTKVLVTGVINLQPNLNGDIFDTFGFRNVQVECGNWYQPGLVTFTNEGLQDKLDAALLAIVGPQLYGELMQGLLWFLFYDE